MENSSAASASSEAGSSRSQEIEELERFIDSYVLEYQVQGLLTDKTEGDGESEKTQSHISQVTPPGRHGARQTQRDAKGPWLQAASGRVALDCQDGGGPPTRVWDPGRKSPAVHSWPL